MTIFLPALAVACGAFFVWLTVWVVNRREYWGTWRRVLFRSFKRTLPWGTTLAVVVVGVLWFVIGPRYRACALVKIRGYPRTSPSFFPASAENDHYRATAVERLQSPIVIRQAIESDGLQKLAELQSQFAANDPGQWISRNLVVTRFGKGDEIYEVSFTARDPEIACKVVGAVLYSNMNRQLEIEDMQAEFALEELHRQLLRLGEEIKLRRDSLSELTRRAGADTFVEVRTPREAVSWQVSVELWEKRVHAEVEVAIGRARIAGWREANRKEEDRQLAIQLAEDDLANMTKTAESLREKLAAEQSQHAESPELSDELNLARLELQSTEIICRRVSDYVVNLATERHFRPAVMILRDARTPTFPEEPTPAQLIAIAGTVAFFTPFLLDVLWIALLQVRSARRRREAGG